MRKLILLLYIILIIGCNKKENSDINEIISFMIDKTAIPLAIPPAINDTVTVIDKTTKDSLKQIKLIVAIYPNLHDLSKSDARTILPERYQSIIKRKEKTLAKFSTGKLTSKKLHQIIIADTIKLKESKDFENFDLLYSFSKFYFDDKGEKVVFSLGISRSRLAGYSTIYYLEKKDEKWKIVLQKNIEEW